MLERNIVLLSSWYSQLFLRYRSTHHVGLVIIASMSDCICHESDKSNSTTRIFGGSGSYLPFPPYFQRIYTSLMCSTSFGLRVMIAMLGCPLVLRRPLRDLAVVNIVSDNSSASSIWLALALIPLIFWPFLSFVSSASTKPIFEPFGNLIS